MILKKDEYKIQDDGIWVSKKALEKWEDHYYKLGKESCSSLNLAMYCGKHSVIYDLLMMFVQPVRTPRKEDEK